MNRFPVLSAGLLLAALISSPCRATIALPMKVMVQSGDTAEFGPIFKEAADTAISRIVPAAVSGPARGTLTVIPGRRSYWMARPSPLPRKRVPVSWLRYVPDAGVTGVDSFTYQINDGTGGTNTATCVVRIHPPEPGGMSVLLITNQTLYSQLTTEVNRLRDDIANEGYAPRIVPWPTVAKLTDSTALRTLWDTLRTEYENTGRTMAGAIFIGRIPYTYTYMNDYSGDEPFWNLSVWYREFNGAEMFRHFSDSDAVLAREDTTFNRGYEGNALRHIWISRLYSVNAAYGDEITLMRRALDANHDYRTGASRYPHKAFLWNQNNDRLYSDTTLREVWPEAERLPFYGRIVRAPGDTLYRIFSTYQPGSAGELWDVTTHMNIDKLNPAPMWLTLWDDSLMDRPFQQRFSLLGGCERASPGSIANQHLLTRGGGGVLSGTCTNHIPYFGYWSLADRTGPKTRMRAFLSAGAPWGRSWIRSNMSIYVNYWYGDFTLKVMMDSANKVPVVDTLRKSFPAAGRVRLSAAARDDDGTITAYEWWFSKPYNLGMNEPDTVTAVPSIEIDLARCTTHVRLEIIDNYKARFFLTMNRDSLVAVPLPVKGERAPGAPSPRVSVFPNPFNPAATIAFRATRPGVAVLRVFNTAGRQVGFQTLTVSGAGGYTMRWEALDSRGKRLPSGLYGFVLEADNKRFCRTMALVK